MSQHIIQGSRLSENIGEYRKLFPVMVPKMVRVGEESGRLEDTLFYLANFYEAEVDAATKSISTTVERAICTGVHSAYRRKIISMGSRVCAKTPDMKSKKHKTMLLKPTSIAILLKESATATVASPTAKSRT